MMVENLIEITGGIYRIYCRLNGRTYIGSASNIHVRVARHRSELVRGRHYCDSLQKDWISFGPDAFQFELVETCHDEKRRLSRERFLISNHDREMLYNTVWKQKDPILLKRKPASKDKAPPVIPKDAQYLSEEEIAALITPSEASRLKGMRLNTFLYYVRHGRSPLPFSVGAFQHWFFDIREIEEWQPIKRKPGRAKSK